MPTRPSGPAKRPVFRRVLVAVDPTPGARAAARLGVALARSLRGQVHACYVVDRSQVTTETDLPALREQLRAELAQEGRRALSGVAALCRSWRVPYRQTLAEGAVARELVRTARRIRADVIVMRTLGRGRVRAFLLGSPAQELVGQAPCPVLLIRHGRPGRRATRARSRSRRG